MPLPFRTIFAIALSLSLASCIANKAYRTSVAQLPANAPPASFPACPGSQASLCSVQTVQSTFNKEPAEVPVSFVEFDDFGQAFLPDQITAAEQTIAAARQRYHDKIVTVLFIHGWKNNASDDSGNVPGFRRLLQQFQPQLNGYGLVGIYFGWRGGVISAAVIKEFTYWNRRDAATYIPGSNLSEALFRVAIATKNSDYKGDGRLIVVGHSFGGLLLERTVTQHITRRIIENPHNDIYPFADLVVFVNEAGAATEAIQLLTMLKSRVKPQTRASPEEFPAIVSITSQGDTATGTILPIGQGANLLKKSLRSYGPPYAPDPFGIKDQRTYYLRTATHIPELQSHLVASGAAARQAYLANGYTCFSIPSVKNKPPDNYYVVPIGGSKNDTPYWIMQMPVQIVPDHSDIFRVEFGLLLQSFVLRQAYQTAPDATDCTFRDENNKPVLPNMQRMRSGISTK